jgi:hypothetical protein
VRDESLRVLMCFGGGGGGVAPRPHNARTGQGQGEAGSGGTVVRLNAASRQGLGHAGALCRVDTL